MRALLRWLLADSWIAKILRSPHATCTASVLAAAYWRLIGPIGDKYELINNNREAFEAMVPWVIGGVLLIGVYRAAGDGYFQKNQSYTGSLEKLLTAIEKIIVAKHRRFEERIANHAVSKSVFTTITHPIQQIEFILGEAVGFLAERSNIPTDKFSITIIEIVQKTSTKQFGTLIAASDNRRNHTPIADLLKAKSALYKCVQSGDSIFIPEKSVASKRGDYYVSERDKEHRNIGSLYCEPVVIHAGSVQSRYVVTFSTYGHLICRTGDLAAEDAVKVYCRQFVRRIHLELTLLTIKKYDEALRASKPKAVPKRKQN